MFNRETALSRLADILKIPSIESPALPDAPFGKDVGDCLDYSLKMLKDLGFSVKNVDGYCGYGEIGQGELFGILCHLDVVPISGAWEYPPFGAEIHNNKMYARGALDNKGPFICALYAIMRLISEGNTPKKRIRFILGCDEESGWLCMERYFKTEETPVLGISPDGDFPVINCEKGVVYHTLKHPAPDYLLDIQGGTRANMVPDVAYAVLKATPEIVGAIKAQNLVCCEIKDGTVIIRAHGKSAHGSRPCEGVNAVIKLLRILSFDPVFAAMCKTFIDNTGKNANLGLSDQKSGALTLNLGTARLENGEVVYELDTRFPVSFTKESITERLKAHAPCAVTRTFYHDPLYVDETHPLVTALLGAYNRVMKTDLRPICIGGATYARVLPLGVAFGPCFPQSPAGIHCADEYIDLEEFDLAAEIYYQAFKELLF